MASYNRVILMGNLTRDPETKYTPGGTCVVKLGLAVNRKWKSEAGELKEEVTFVDCDAFGRTAETLGQWMKKGKPILIEGRLKLDQWDDKQTGQKRYKLGVVVETFQFVESGGGKGGQSAAEDAPPDAPGDAAPRQKRPPAAKAPTGNPAHDYAPDPNDDVPF